VDVTCPNPKCAQTFEWTVNVNVCPWCLTEIKRPPLPKGHYVQYHKTDQYGPPGSRPGHFGIETNKSVDGLHGSTVWLISGEGTPKEYFLDCFFVVDEVGILSDDDPDFKYYVRGKRGRKLKPHIPVSQYGWFRDLRARLADFAAGLSDIGPKTVAELRELVGERDAF
jgi:hypothetical protein